MTTLDLPLAERIGSAMHENPYLNSRRLRIETEEGRVVLHGTVGTYYEKQMAQETLRGIEGVRAIENRLVVVA